MFVYDFIQVDVPFEEARRCLLAAAAGAGPVEVGSTGVVSEQDHVVVMPVRWPCPGLDAAAAQVEGTLELRRMVGGGVHLSMLGRCTVSSGKVDPLHATALHQLAETAVRERLRLVAQRLAGSRCR